MSEDQLAIDIEELPHAATSDAASELSPPVTAALRTSDELHTGFILVDTRRRCHDGCPPSCVALHALG